MKKIHRGYYEIETAGLVVEGIYFRPGPSICGTIKDGVYLRLKRMEGSFSISFDDLEQMYELAKRAREEAGAE